MSHFTVLVVGEEPEEQLAPFQETSEGHYAQFIDKTDEYAEQYANDTVMMYDHAGGWFFAWKLPDDVVDKSTLPSKQIAMAELFPTLREYVEEWHGAEEHKGKFGYWANPDAKWDWYSLGGRWAGYFKIKSRPLLAPTEVIFNKLGLSLGEMQTLAERYLSDPEGFGGLVAKYGDKEAAVREAVMRFTQEVFPEHAVGEGGAFSNAARPGWADQLRKRDIDIEGMREDARTKATAQYDEFEAATWGLEPPLKSWDDFRGDFETISAAREAWHAQPWVQAVGRLHVFGDALEIFRVRTGGRKKYVESAVESVLSTFAVLMDGQWYEQGSMGWWGIVTNEALEYDWCAKFMELFDSLPDDTLLSVYDCHI